MNTIYLTEIEDSDVLKILKWYNVEAFSKRNERKKIYVLIV